MKQKHYIAGLYYRLSQEDERQGESVSIDNQRTILRKYAEERGFEIHDEYIDDGISGTTFQRPEVQRLLDDAKTGVINTIIVKDLSRFGRNYIEVGQYVDYVFPAFGIRFIAIQDNVDTENRDSGAMEMMPIMNVFNEWHAANTSKKIRAVRRSNAKEGIYTAKKASYGYKMGTDKKRAPVIDEETAPIVKRIFERDVRFGNESEKNLRNSESGRDTFAGNLCLYPKRTKAEAERGRIMDSRHNKRNAEQDHLHWTYAAVEMDFAVL